ncbi:MAG TPA: protein phosphatase 2C domain-containing protein [Candidatus Binataceae bacterium]|nr:protein phosphatase 2C domain-containing protein [Candidatus Binataceae bacterium]
MTTNFIGTDGFVYAPGNAQAVGRREDQQDSFGFSDPRDTTFMAHGGMLAIVADGMGGMAHGAEASQLAVHAFLEHYASKQPGEPITQALGRAVQAADRSVFDFATSVGLARDVGSTLVAAAFTPSGLYWMSVGDSALYLCREGSLTQLNHPHTLGARLAELVKRGAMSPEDAAIDPDRDALTSYIGAGAIAEIDSPSEGVEVAPGDTIILCSDGLYRALSHEEISRIAASAADAQEAADTLIANALARELPHQDNVTVLCVRVTEKAAK